MNDRTQEIEAKIEKFRGDFEVIKITDQASLDVASEALQRIKAFQENVKKFFEKPLRAAKYTLDTIKAQRDDLLDKAVEPETALRLRVAAYLRAEKDRAEAARLQALREAEAKAAVERARQLAEVKAKADAGAAIRARQAAEAKAKALAEEARLIRQVAEAKNKADAEAAIRARQAVEAKAKAYAEEVERVRQLAEEQAQAEAARIEASPLIFTVEAAPEAAKADGVSMRKTWDFEITDPMAIPPEYKKDPIEWVDQVKIRKVVKALGAECRITGIRIFEKHGIAVRQKKERQNGR